MKRTASANTRSRSSIVRGSNRGGRGYVMCIDNHGYPASLEVGKIYRTLSVNAGVPNWIRVIDESGEDYLYPAKRFVPMVVPLKGRRALEATVAN